MRGEFLEVLDDARKWWRARNIRGLVGYVPHTIVAPFEHPQNPHHHGTSHSSSGGGRSGGRGNKGEYRYF